MRERTLLLDGWIDIFRGLAGDRTRSSQICAGVVAINVRKHRRVIDCDANSSTSLIATGRSCCPPYSNHSRFAAVLSSTARCFKPEWRINRPGWRRVGIAIDSQSRALGLLGQIVKRTGIRFIDN